jgi:putative flippase GtrA
MLIQFFRYAIVGVIAFMIDFAALFFLTDIFHFHYLVSAAMAFLLGLATNYILASSLLSELLDCALTN